jgi:hypothetical protein
MSEEKKVPAKVDASAPKFLEISIKGPNGENWGSINAPAKSFSSGSVGYYANSKLENPESGERYQVGMNIILIGSKPA